MKDARLSRLRSAAHREVVACAAVCLPGGLIVAGKRHRDCMESCLNNGIPAREFKAATQGFMTTHGRFVDRIEARRIQEKAGIPSANPDGYRGTGLFSEDLY